MTEYSKYIFLENLRQRLERLPMLKVLVPLVAGILLADVVTLPQWGVAIGFVVCAGMGVVLRRRGVADVYIVVASTFVLMLSALVIGRDKLTRVEGLIFIACYVGYVYTLL